MSFGKDDFEFLQVEGLNIDALYCSNILYDYKVKVIKDLRELSYGDIYREALLKDSDDLIDYDIQDEVFRILDQKGYVKYERKRIN